MLNRILQFTFVVGFVIFTPPKPGYSSTETCKYNGKAFKQGYLQCLERQDSQYAQKAAGYTTLGNRYEFAQGVTRHYGQAAMYYRLACDFGNGDGCVYLARLYRRGKGVKKNKKLARHYLKRSYIFD